MVDSVGEKIKPYLSSVRTMIENYPEGEKYDQETVNLLFQYVGILYEEGCTDLQSLKNQIADKLGEEFKPFVKMVYEGIIEWKRGAESVERTGGVLEQNDN